MSFQRDFTDIPMNQRAQDQEAIVKGKASDILEQLLEALGVSNSYNSNTQNNTKTGYDELLRQGDQSDALTQYIQSLGVNDPNNLSSAQRSDWNKQLLDNLLARQNELDKRKYNEQLLAEQRLYDSPTAMLARLMASGMSRDAALSMLSGSGGSGGSGVPYTDGQQLDQGLAPSESQLNKIQGDTSIANAVFNGLSTITGLVNMGFGAAGTMAQTAFTKAQNVLTGKQIDAYNVAGDAYSVLNAIGAGIDSFGSIGAAIGAIQKSAAGGNDAAAAFVQNGGIERMRNNAPFVSRTLGQLYQDERASKDYATTFDQLVRQNSADILLTEANVDAVIQGIKNAKAELNQILANTEFIEANKQVCLKQADYLVEQANLAKIQGRLVDAQTLLTQAERLRTDAETKSLQLSNQVSDAVQNGVYYDEENKEIVSGLDLITGTTIQNLFGTARTLAKTTNSDYVNAAVSMQLSNFESITAANALRTLRSNASINFTNNNKEIVNFGWALEDCGIGSILKIDSKDVLGGSSMLGNDAAKQFFRAANRTRQFNFPMYR